MKADKIRSICMAWILLESLGLTACGSSQPDYQTLVAKTHTEGMVESLAMPGDWANWDETWKDLSVFYQLSHQDTDMNSAQELERFSEGIGDIGDVGYSYAQVADQKDLTLKYKSSYWDEIPKWAKDEDGDWIVTYTGTIAFLVKDSDKKVALSWQDLLDGNYTVEIAGDVETSSLAQYTVYAAAVAFGGNADNIQPGIDFFKELAQEGRLTDHMHESASILDCNIDVNIKWDFIALSYRDLFQEKGRAYGVCIPSDGSVTVGYASVINKLAEHPNAAMLAREYILSDAGQLNLASGYATPIRSIVLPKELEERRIDRAQYQDEMIQNGLAVTDEVVREIAQEWEKQVIPILDERGRAE